MCNLASASGARVSSFGASLLVEENKLRFHLHLLELQSMTSMDFRADYRDRGGDVSSLSKGKGYSTLPSLQGFDHSRPAVARPAIAHPPLLACPSRDVEPRKNIMSVELAIKRELAYQRKMATLQMQTPVDSRETPTPFKGSSPSSSLVGMKRKEISSNIQCLPPQQPTLSYTYRPLEGHLGSLICKVCQVSCSSAFNLKQHREGSKHKAKLKELKESQKKGEEKGKKPLWCELCRVPCMNELCFDQHRTGKKHMALIQAIEDAKKMREEAETAEIKWEDLEWEMIA